MALLDLTSVFGQINDVKRNLFLEDDLTVKFISAGSVGKPSQVILELAEGWYLDKNPEKDVSSPEYYLLSVAIEDESVDLSRIIPRSATIKIGSVEYSCSQYTRPREGTKVWSLRVQTAQMMNRDI